MFQDKTFVSDGSMKGDTQGSVPNVHPYWVPESLGDMETVNGKVSGWGRVCTAGALHKPNCSSVGFVKQSKPCSSLACCPLPLRCITVL